MEDLALRIRIPAQACPNCDGPHIITMYFCPDADPTNDEKAVLLFNARWYLAQLSEMRYFNWN